jgi:glycogen operon protein
LLVYLVVNAYWEPLECEPPRLGPESVSNWLRWIDTALESPNDIAEWQASPPVSGRTYRVEARSVAVLFARLVAG